MTEITAGHGQAGVKAKASPAMIRAGVSALRPFFSGSEELWTLEFVPMARAAIEAALEHLPCASSRSVRVGRKCARSSRKI